MSYESAQRTVALFQRRKDVAVLGRRMPAGMSYAAIAHTLERVLAESPTAYNAQDVRMLVLLGSDHTQYWKTVREQARSEMDKTRITTQLLPGMGTALFFTDMTVVKALCARFPKYAQDLPQYMEDDAAIASAAAWTALSQQEGMGAVLAQFGAPFRHDGSNADIQTAQGNRAGMYIHSSNASAAGDEELHAAFPPELQVPASWSLSSELVFGSAEALVETMPAVHDSERFMVFSDTYSSTGAKFA